MNTNKMSGETQGVGTTGKISKSVINNKKYVMNRTEKLIEELINAGIYQKDFKRILNPLSSTFNYIPVNSKVKIEKAEDVLPKDLYNSIVDFYDDYKSRFHANIWNNHYLPVSIAYIFSYDKIKVVDGYLIDPDTNIRHAHTICEYRGRYFDFLDEIFDISDSKSEYYAEKMFTAYERYLISLAISYLDTNDLSFIRCDTLINDPQLIFTSPFMLKKDYDGSYVLNQEGKLVFYNYDDLIQEDTAA